MSAVRRSLGLNDSGARGRAASKAHGGNIDRAGGGRLGDVVASLASRVDNGHVGSATTLGVLDGGSLAGAGAALLAAGSIAHGVLELKIAAELGVDAEAVQGKGRDFLIIGAA